MSSSRLISIYSDISTPLRLTEGQRRDILKLKKIIGGQNVILQANDELRIMHYVGFVSSGEIRLQLLPKIYSNMGRTGEEKQDSVDLMIKLLSYSGYLNYKEIDEPQLVRSCNADLFEIFTSIFITRFIKAFRRDIYRSYEDVNENRQFIKGKILFRETIRNNIARKDRHFVKYDEFVPNTLLNRIFKSLIEKLVNKTRVTENKRQLKMALDYLEEVETIRIYSGLFEKVIFNRINDVYRPIYNLAKLLYFNRQPAFAEGDASTFAFLVPLNELFEYYIYKLLLSYSVNTTCKVYYQSQRKCLTKVNGRQLLLKPDITVFHGSTCEVIIDTKFKNPFKPDGQIDLAMPDLYQVIAYAICYNCQNVYLIYPHFAGEPNQDIEIACLTIPIETKKVQVRILQADVMASAEKVQQELGEHILRHEAEGAKHCG